MIYTSLIERLKTQHTTINPVISNVSNERLHHHPEPQKWSIYDNVVHLAVYQTVFLGRMKQILSEDDPMFGRYVGDIDENFAYWREKTVNELLKKIHTERQEINSLIFNLNDEQLCRKGTHLKYGQLSILEWTEFFLLHEAHHLFTMFQLAHG